MHEKGGKEREGKIFYENGSLWHMKQQRREGVGGGGGAEVGGTSGAETKK